jgi:phosphoenolpyruvate-protein phosphotransferase (PTS system enzyme I)
VGDVRIRGRRASPGFAAGEVMVLPRNAAARRSTGDPAQEALTLDHAIKAAASELAELARRARGEESDIIGFQLALLGDEALIEPALAAIQDGAAADHAWSSALDREIADYEAAEDEYFRARAGDFKDIRDRVLGHLTGARIDAPRSGAILVADDLPPSRFLAIDWSRGGAILLSGGSASSHVAMLARSRGVPMIVGLGGGVAALTGEVLVDAGAGEVVVAPDDEERRRFEAKRQADRHVAREAASLRDKPAVTRDGVAVAVHLNISDPDELASLDPNVCDGIGLVRTEFLFHARRGLPDEETQLRVYRRLASWAAGKPVTIRTLDAGGDKPIEGLTFDGESNPFLGVRGIRLSLARPDVFRVQLRALARAAMHGDVRIMLPMITIPDEIAAARAMLHREVRALVAAGIPARSPPIGIMVEVPAVAIAIDLYDAAFYSIGSNDLTQYVTAAGRDVAAVADLADASHPAVNRLIERVAQHGRERKREVCLCGDIGGDAEKIPSLLRAGLRSLSVPPATLARVKAAIGAVDIGATYPTIASLKP